MSTKGPLRKEGILSRKLGDEWMLYDPESGVVHIINATAESVWDLCDGKHGPDEIATSLRETFEVSDGTPVREEVHEIIEAFFDKGLLRSKGK
jgi:PqqD family protein of HPr-rel-A system